MVMLLMVININLDEIYHNIKSSRKKIKRTITTSKYTQIFFEVAATAEDIEPEQFTIRNNIEFLAKLWW